MNLTISRDRNSLDLPSGGGVLDSAVDTSAQEDRGRAVLTRRKPRGQVLSISWLHGEFRAGIIRGGLSSEIWTESRPVRSLDAFAGAVKIARSELNFRGKDVVLVYEDEDFRHQLESIPPASKSVQRRFLKRRVEQYEEESESLLWEHRPALAKKKDHNVILHLLHNETVVQLVRILTRLKLKLTRIVPVLALTQEVVSQSPGSNTDVLLVAMGLGSAVQIVVGRKDGQVYFSRTLLTDWRKDPERVELEINRSLLYARQKFLVSVNQIQLLGECGKDGRRRLESTLGDSFSIQSKEVEPGFWLTAAAGLPQGGSTGLVAAYHRERRRRLLSRYSLLGCCWLIFSVSLFASLDRERDLGLQKNRIEVLRQHVESLEVRWESLEKRNERAIRNLRVIREIDRLNHPPIALSFLKFTAHVLPSELRLSEFAIDQQPESEIWKFRLKGVSDANLDTSLNSLRRFEKKLLEGPFEAKIGLSNLDELESIRYRRFPLNSTNFSFGGSLFEL